MSLSSQVFQNKTKTNCNFTIRNKGENSNNLFINSCIILTHLTPSRLDYTGIMSSNPLGVASLLACINASFDSKFLKV